MSIEGLPTGSKGSTVSVEQVREYFPGLDDKVFLDAACVSLPPVQAVNEVRKFLDMTATMYCRDASLHHIEMDGTRELAVREAARLLEAELDEIALVESTTHGLNLAAQAIPFTPQDNVVIVDLEFLQVAIPWVKMREEGRIREVRMARNVDGTVPVESIAALTDASTKAIIISSVQWSNGYRVDLRALGEFAKANGIYLVVDAIHQLGAVKLSVRDSHIDILMAGGHKWLNSPFGCGVLYINRETMPTLQPSSWGYLGLEAPEGGWGRYFATPSISPLRPYEFPATAKSFETNGTANYPGAIGLGQSLKLVNEIGIDQVQGHVFSLTSTVHEELNRLGLKVVTHPDPKARSGITVFQVSDNPDRNEEFLQRLLDDRVYLAMRYTSNVGGIRISTHYFNNEDDLDELFAAIRKHLN